MIRYILLLNSILHKVIARREPTLDTIISGRGVYKLSQKALDDYPSIEQIQSKGHKFDIGSSAFKILKDIVFFEEKPNDGREYVEFLGLLNLKRVYFWIDKRYINPPQSFHKYKVIIPQANGSGALGEAISTPLIGKPLIGATETFLSIGSFDTYLEAEAALKYVKTKFSRALLGILKITQANTREKWMKVPLQDFTTNSDIDWSQSVADIDQQLYKKYGLSESEIAFIEEKVQAME